MFVFLIDRKSNLHIVDFQHAQGRYRTICGKIYHQKDKISTLSADNTFDGLCQDCKRFYDDMYSSDLEDDIRVARSNVFHSMSHIADYHHLEFLGPKSKYEALWERIWTKLFRAKTFYKSKSHKYYGK